MTLLMVEGFELTKTTNALAERFTNIVSSGLTFDAGRIHGTAIKADHTALQTWKSRAINTAVLANVRVGFAFKATRVADNVQLLTIYHSSGAAHCSFEVVENSVSDFLIKFYRSAAGSKVLLATSTAVPYNTWVYLEFAVTVDNTNGRVQVRSNETDIIPLTASLDTQDAAGTAWDKLAWFMQARSVGEFCWMDDGYVLDGGGSAPWNSLLGDVVTQGMLPIADGGVSDMTPSAGTDHFAMVDDASESDGDTTYLSAVANEKKELFDQANLSVISDNILGVEHRLTTRLTVAGSRNVKFSYRDPAAADFDGSAIAVTATSYDIKTLAQQVNPISGVAWTLADINDGKFGFKTVA